MACVIPGIRLRIRQQGLRSRDVQVWLDDTEISHGLRGIEVQWEAGRVTEATLRIMVDSIDVDTRTLAYLQACVVKSEGADSG